MYDVGDDEIQEVTASAKWGWKKKKSVLNNDGGDDEIQEVQSEVKRKRRQF